MIRFEISLSFKGDNISHERLKTVPAQLMGAISANIPAICLVTGPMATGSHQGRRVGACTDCRSFWKDYRAGVIDIEEIWRVNDELVPTVGVRLVSFVQVCVDLMNEFRLVGSWVGNDFL